jgi:PEP-CTERM motif
MNLTTNSFKKLLLGTATLALAVVPGYSAEAANIVLSGFNPDMSLLPELLSASSHSVDAESYQSDLPSNLTNINALIIQTEFSEYLTPEAFLASLAGSLSASVAGNPTVSTPTFGNIIIPSIEEKDGNIMLLGSMSLGGSLSPASDSEVWIMAYTGGDDCRNEATCSITANTINEILTPAEEPASVPEPASVLGLLTFGTVGLLVSRKAK